MYVTCVGYSIFTLTWKTERLITEPWQMRMLEGSYRMQRCGGHLEWWSKGLFIVRLAKHLVCNIRLSLEPGRGSNRMVYLYKATWLGQKKSNFCSWWSVLQLQPNFVSTFKMLLGSVFQLKPYAHVCMKVVFGREDQVFGSRCLKNHCQLRYVWAVEHDFWSRRDGDLSSLPMNLCTASTTRIGMLGYGEGQGNSFVLQTGMAEAQ